jgi:hypothetical protein
MLTSEEAAAKLGITLRRMQQLLRQRRVPGARLIGRVWHVPEDFTITPGSRGPAPKHKEKTMQQTYTLTADEARIYDSRDDRAAKELFRSLRERFGEVGSHNSNVTEVYHPDGHIVGQFSAT